MRENAEQPETQPTPTRDHLDKVSESVIYYLTAPTLPRSYRDFVDDHGGGPRRQIQPRGGAEPEISLSMPGTRRKSSERTLAMRGENWRISANRGGIISIYRRMSGIGARRWTAEITWRSPHKVSRSAALAQPRGKSRKCDRRASMARWRTGVISINEDTGRVSRLRKHQAAACRTRATSLAPRSPSLPTSILLGQQMFIQPGHRATDDLL